MNACPPPNAPSPSHTDFSRLEERITKRMDRSDETVTKRLDQLGEAMTQLISMQYDLQHQERLIELQEQRLAKLEDLADAARGQAIEHSHLATSVAKLEAKVSAQEKEIQGVKTKLDGWVNKGFGAVLVISLAWTVASKLIH